MQIDVIGTDEYHDEWGSTPHDEIRTVADYVEDKWNSWISSNYEIEVYGWSRDWMSIPESEIESNVSSSDDLSDRRDDMHSYLEDEYDRYEDLRCEGVIVLDYIDNTGVPLGQASLGTAGREGGWFSDPNRVGAVNMARFPRGSWSYHSETQHYGTALHELQHLYDVRHTDGTLYSDDTGSFVLPAGFDHSSDDSCLVVNDGTIDKRREAISTCAQSTIKSHTDSNIN